MEPSALQITSAIRDDHPARPRRKTRGDLWLAAWPQSLLIEVIRAQNVAPEKIDNYEVDPQTLLRQFEFEEMGDRMLAIYHSHPVSEAYPSATDAWNANYPDTYYLICSLENDETPVLRAFHLLPDFDDLDVAALRETLPFYETAPASSAISYPTSATVRLL
ncbi:MAG: M67 family metallopeptidase [Caldilineaceae bacterium]